MASALPTCQLDFLRANFDVVLAGQGVLPTGDPIAAATANRSVRVSFPEVDIRP